MWSSAIEVHPWVGKNYQHPENLLHKTLVLGESNFTESGKFKSDLVINCVLNDMSIDPTEERDTTGFCRFSTKIRRIVFGRDEAIGPNSFWQDVAFYNFVQSLVGDKARIRPTQEMWEGSVPAFIEVVLSLQPSRIFVLGKANWRNLLAHIEHEIVDPFTVRLKVGSEFVAAGYINHPSSSLSYNKWQPIAQKLLLS